MKKILILLLLFLTLAPIYSETTYTVETAYGDKTVIVPDGYTEKDVLLIIAKAYYELNEEQKQLTTEYENLKTQLNEYKETNSSLRNLNSELQNNYDSLVKKLETLNSMGVIKGLVGGHLSFFDRVFGGGLDLGLIILDTYMVNISVNYPLTFSIGLGILF